MNSIIRNSNQAEMNSAGRLALAFTNAFGLNSDESLDRDCPHCPVNETGSYIEFHYRRGRGSWDQIEEYADRLARYVYATRECDDETRQFLARLANIPEHRRDLSQYECEGADPKTGAGAPASHGSWRFQPAA